MNPYTNQYQQNQIMTASQEQILLMLYDGAIRFCREAMKASEDGDTAYKLSRISKVFAIVTEFSDSLNHQIGGDIATDLDSLYHFILKELGKARKDTSGEHLKVVEKMLLDLRQTWGEAVEINKQEQTVVAKKHQESTYGDDMQQYSATRLNAAG